MIDVVEIDAASYTGVDNIREVIDHAKFTPTQGKYKVYIIDEVHMLSKGAFNALLKTLEEPPAHAIFLLATTEIHKIPDTILSRVIRFDLTKISEVDMRGLLQQICQQEKISYEEEALNMIIHRSRGSLRDSLTMLEKCIFEKSLQTSNVEHALHLVNHSFLKKTFDAVRSGESSQIQDIISTLESETTDIRQFSAQMTEWIVDHIGEAFDEKAFPVYREIFDLFTHIFIQSKLVAVPMDILKMALYEKIKIGSIEAPKKPIKKNQEEEKNTISQISEEPKQAELPPPEHELPPAHGEISEAKDIIESAGKELAPERNILPETQKIIQVWEADITLDIYLQKIQELGIKSTLIPLLKTATLQRGENSLTLQTTSFGKTRCEEANTMVILSQAARDLGVEHFTVETQSSEEKVETVDIARSIFE